MKETRDLDSLLRRFLAGDLTKSSLIHAFAAEHARLAAALDTLMPRRGELRRISPSMLVACETQLDLARHAYYDERFIDARTALRQAAQAHHNLVRALAAEDDRLTAVEELEELIAAYDLDGFRSSPALRIPLRLLERAARLLDSGAHAKAVFQARLARRLVERLATRGDVGRAELLRRLLSLCSERAGTPGGEPSVAKVRDVVEQGALVLGSWLVDDLENRATGFAADGLPDGFRSPLTVGAGESLERELADAAAQSAALSARLAEAAHALSAAAPAAHAGGHGDDPGGS